MLRRLVGVDAFLGGGFAVAFAKSLERGSFALFALSFYFTRFAASRQGGVSLFRVWSGARRSVEVASRLFAFCRRKKGRTGVLRRVRVVGANVGEEARSRAAFRLFACVAGEARGRIRRFRVRGRERRFAFFGRFGENNVVLEIFCVNFPKTALLILDKNDRLCENSVGKGFAFAFRSTALDGRDAFFNERKKTRSPASNANDINASLKV